MGRGLRSIFSLGGRISEFSPPSAPVTHRLLAGAIMWKSTFWWNFLSAASQVSGEPRRDSEVHATAGRPHVLWEDVLCNALGPDWYVQANQPQIWRALWGKLRDSAFCVLKLKVPKARATVPAPRVSSNAVSRQDALPPMTWSFPLPFVRRILVSGDNKAVVSWCNGDWKVQFRTYGSAVHRIQQMLASIFSCGDAGPPQSSGQYLYHHKREHNGFADRLAAKGAVEGSFLAWKPSLPQRRFYWLQFDGAFKPHGAGAGVVVWASDDVCDRPASCWTKEWHLHAWCHISVAKVSATYSEMCACALSMCFLKFICFPERQWSIANGSLEDFTLQRIISMI